MKLSLYQTASCPYCRRVLRAAEALGVEIELRDVQREPERWRELIDATGSRTVPCLRIESDDGSVEWMHESRDIVAHLEAL